MTLPTPVIEQKGQSVDGFELEQAMATSPRCPNGNSTCQG